MSIPHVFSQVQSQDFTLTPITVHKQFVIQRNTDLYSGSLPNTGSGYKLWEARYLGEKLKISSSNYATNSWDGSNKHIIWKSLDSQYYRFPYDRTSTFEHSNERFTFKFLSYSASAIVVPQSDFGESIKPGSVEFTSSAGFNCRDDGNGNLYDVGIDTGSVSSVGMVAYWPFRNQFRYLKNQNSYWYLDDGTTDYVSKTFSPDRPSIAKNLRFRSRLDVGSGYDTGFHSIFSGNSYILTPNRKEFNFAQNEDFSISFWVYFVDTSGTGSLISKNGVIEKQTYGIQEKYNVNDLVVNVPYISSSYYDQSINVYPYHFELHDFNTIRFKRSDGIRTISLDLFPDNDSWNHVCLVKSGSLLSYYHNGGLIVTGSDTLGHCQNDHSLMFGSKNRLYDQAFTGYLDEIRIFDRALYVDQIVSLSNNVSQLLYQTAVVGNVFYKKGLIVFNGLDSSYPDVGLNAPFTLKFRGTHTIYQYECLVRIPKGSFNLSQNPSSLQSPNSDLIINDMTGSLEDGALFPYATGVGLYNDKNELLAVAKLSQPLMMRDDVDLNLLIRWDG